MLLLNSGQQNLISLNLLQKFRQNAKYTILTIQLLLYNSFCQIRVMSKKEQLNQLKQMGFSQQAIQKAAKIARQSGLNIIDVITNNNQQVQPKQINNNNIRTFLKSKQQIKFQQYDCIYNENENNFEFEKDDQREEGIPVALKNVSNCCYLNSLLQAYFLMPKFVELILNAVPLSKDQLDQLILNNIRNKRIFNSYNLLHCLQQLYSNMILTTKKYLDPSDILKNLVDSVGNKISYGEQKDLSEINLQLISRLQECTTFVQSNLTFLKSSPSPNQSPDKETQFNSTLPQIKSPLKQLLFGERAQISNNQDDTKIQSQFFGLLLNPVHGNLYKALDEQFHYTIEQDDKKIKKDVWITKQPDYLFFYFQRTGYDKKKGVIKMKDKVKFDFQIYLDRYMYKNKDKQIDKNPVLIKNIQNRYQTIKQITHTKSLYKALGACHNHNSFLKCPIQLPDKQILINYLETLQKQLQQCENNISKLQSRQQKYSLRFIIVHRGQADSGHYWGYGFSGSWWRYDINNSKIEKQVMIKEIQNGDVVVYALVYSKLEQNFEPSFDFFLKDEKFEFFGQNKNYNHMVPQKIKQKILMENLRRQRIHEEKKLSQSVSEITLEYQERYKIINDIVTKYNAKNDHKYPIISNFSAYLRQLTQQPSTIFKYQILDLSLKSFTKYSITQISNQNFVKQLSASFKQNLNKQLIPDKFTLTKAEYKHIMDKYEDFQKNIKANYLVQLMLNNIIESKIHEAIQCALYVVKLNLKNYYQKIAQQFLAVLILVLIFQNKPVYKQYLWYFQKNSLRYYQQICKLTNLSVNKDNKYEISIEDIAKKQSNKDLYRWELDIIENQNVVTKLDDYIIKGMSSIRKYVEIYKKIIKSEKIYKKEQLIK